MSHQIFKLGRKTLPGSRKLRSDCKSQEAELWTKLLLKFLNIQCAVVIYVVLFPWVGSFFSKFMQFEQNHSFEVLFRRETNDSRFWILLIPFSVFLLMTPEFTRLCGDNFFRKVAPVPLEQLVITWVFWNMFQYPEFLPSIQLCMIFTVAIYFQWLRINHYATEVEFLMWPFRTAECRQLEMKKKQLGSSLQGWIIIRLLGWTLLVSIFSFVMDSFTLVKLSERHNDVFL